MDEARAVLERIRRIDALQRERAGAAALLAEVEQLLVEARGWLDAEEGAHTTLDALGRAHGAVERTRKAMIAM
jgi:hypothetical protein